MQSYFYNGKFWSTITEYIIPAAVPRVVPLILDRGNLYQLAQHIVNNGTDDMGPAEFETDGGACLELIELPYAAFSFDGEHDAGDIVVVNYSPGASLRFYHFQK